MSLDKTLKAIGLRKKTPADRVREAGANLNARFAKLRGATPESRARAAGARFGLARHQVLRVDDAGLGRFIGFSRLQPAADGVDRPHELP